MKSRIQHFAAGIFASVLCCILPALGQNSTLTFNGGYQGAVWCSGSEGCVATGFYDGTINGVQVGPGAPGGPGMICDDYKDNIQTGETWTANGVNVSTLTSGNIGSTLFGSNIGVAGYQELAWVVNQMFTTNPSANQQSVFSQVLWAITGGVQFAQLSSAAQSLYTWLINNVGSLPSLSTYTNLMLYTPNPQGPNEAQEMWGELMQAPEGGTALIYLLLAGVACFGTIFHSRNQRAKRASA